MLTTQYSYPLPGRSLAITWFVSLLVCLTPTTGFTDPLTTITIYGSASSKNFSSAVGSISLQEPTELKRDGVGLVQSIVEDIPNLNWAAGTSRPRFFQVRGIGELEQYEGAPNSSVAVIVDDVDLTGVGAAFSLFDRKQLEIHRGPQPIRFGSSALAGALNLVSKPPTGESSGEFLFSLGKDRLLESGVAFSEGLSEQSAFRFTLLGRQQDGFRDNEYLGSSSTNQREEIGGRAQLEYSPGSDSQFLFSVSASQLNNGYDAFSIFNGYNTQSDKPGKDAQRLILYSITANSSLSDWLRLKSVTSFYETESNYSFDGDWGSNSFWSPFDPYDYFSDTDRDRKVFAQQIRVSSDAWMIGGYFQSLRETTEIRELEGEFVYDSLSSEYQADSYAGFGNIEFELADEISMALGGRLEQRDSFYSDSRAVSFAPEDSMFGASSSLSYQPSSAELYYLLASRGFKGGGFNSDPDVPVGLEKYDPETLVNFEVGTKLAWRDKLRLAATLFYNLRKEQQLKLALQVDPGDPLSFLYLTDNAAESSGYGAEVELEYWPTESLLLSSTLGVLETRIDSVDPSLAALQGREQSHAPNWNYSLRSNYQLSNALELELGLSGKDSFYFDDSHDSRSSVYHLLNAALNFNYRGWFIKFWGKNLTDKKYAVRGFFFGNEPPDFLEKEYLQLGDPRSFGVTASFSF